MCRASESDLAWAGPQDVCGAHGLPDGFLAGTYRDRNKTIKSNAF